MEEPVRPGPPCAVAGEEQAGPSGGLRGERPAAPLQPEGFVSQQEGCAHGSDDRGLAAALLLLTMRP